MERKTYVVEVELILQQRPQRKIMSPLRGRKPRVEIRQHAVLRQRSDDHARVAQARHALAALLPDGGPAGVGRRAAGLNVGDLAARGGHGRAGGLGVFDAREAEAGLELDYEGGPDVLGWVVPAAEELERACLGHFFFVKRKVTGLRMRDKRERMRRL